MAEAAGATAKAAGLGDITPSREYVDNASWAFFTRGENPPGLIGGTMAKVALLAGLTLATYRVIIFARRYERIQKAFEAVHLTPNWDWLLSAAVAGGLEFLILDWAVGRDLAVVHKQLNARIDERTSIFREQLGEYQATAAADKSKDVDIATLQATIAGLEEQHQDAAAIRRQLVEITGERDDWRSDYRDLMSKLALNPTGEQLEPLVTLAKSFEKPKTAATLGRSRFGTPSSAAGAATTRMNDDDDDDDA